MEALIGLQAGLNLLFLSLGLYLYKKRSNAFDGEAQAQAKAYLTVLESRVEEAEGRTRKVINESERQLKILLQICDRAAAVMDQAQVPSITLSSSEEQKELLEARPKGAESIPTVADVQKMRQKITADSAVDLPQLLNEQLA